MTTPKLLLTPEEAAVALGVGRTKLYELMGEGRIESVRIGGSRRVPVDAVDRFVERLRGGKAEVSDRDPVQPSAATASPLPEVPDRPFR